MIALITDIPGMVSLTTDAWSSRLYKGYLSAMLHWIDKQWMLEHVLLDFVRFSTPHKGATTSTLRFEILSNWNLLLKIRAVTTDNASDMCSAFLKFNDMLNIRKNTTRWLFDIHVRFIAHVINLAVSDCLKDFHENVIQIRSLIQAIRSSLKQRDIFEATQNQLRLEARLPFLDVPTRWNSLFDSFDSWRINEKRCHNIDRRARRLLAIHASSVSNEHHFSIPSNLVGAHCTSLTDSSIWSTMLVHAWGKQFEPGKPGKPF